jgi:predicted transcriptional regulator
MKVGDVCNRVVIFVTQDEPVQCAAELMRKHHVGNLVVTEFGDQDKVPVGIITDRDIVLEVVAKGIDSTEITVGDILSQDPPLVANEADDISDALEAMREQGVRRVPVVGSRHELVGVFALDDVLQQIAFQLGTMADIVGSQRRQEAEVRP